MWGWGSGHADPGQAVDGQLLRGRRRDLDRPGRAQAIRRRACDGNHGRQPAQAVFPARWGWRSARSIGQRARGNPIGRGLSFHRSDDEGETWSQPTPINPPETDAVFTNDKSIVLKDGRVVVPFYASIGPITAPVSKYRSRFGEEMATAELGALSYNSAYYSDDDGATWTRSRNETYVMLDHGIGGKYIMGEPELVELDDGTHPDARQDEPGRLLPMLFRRPGRDVDRAGTHGTGPVPRHLVASSSFLAQVTCWSSSIRSPVGRA